MSSHPQFNRTLLAWLAVLGACVTSDGADEQPRPVLVFSATAGVEQSHDDNIMLQSVTDKAGIDSWVTALTTQLALDWRATAQTTAKFNYAPTWTRFASRPSEDFCAHRLAGSIQGRNHHLTFMAQGAMTIIDGSDESVTWTGPGGTPATGAATVRDRRDQAVYRATARAEWTSGDWFIRPLAALYLGDFQTHERATPGYQNNVDRDDLSAGLDFGRMIKPGLSSHLGYRHGRQDQATLLSYPEEYDNSYDRCLAGLDGRPVTWLTLAISAGPEFRRYGPHVHTGFPNRSVTNLFVDATATITVTNRDAVTLLVRQFEQLSSAGRGAFEDLNFDAAWRHTFSKKFTAGATLHAYNTDFLQPAVRNDWLFSARAQASIALDESWTLDGTLAREEGISRVPNTPGREYARDQLSIAARVKL